MSMAHILLLTTSNLLGLRMFLSGCAANAHYMLSFVRVGTAPPLEQAMHMYFHIPHVPVKAAVLTCLRETNRQIVAGIEPVNFSKREIAVTEPTKRRQQGSNTSDKHISRSTEIREHPCLASGVV